MARGNVLRTDLVGVLEELTELEPRVAHHAWIRRSAREVFLHEIACDLAKLAVQIQGVEWDPETIRHRPSILRIGGTATALFVINAGIKPR